MFLTLYLHNFPLWFESMDLIPVVTLTGNHDLFLHIFINTVPFYANLKGQK
jgi:hypothetical protein